MRWWARVFLVQVLVEIFHNQTRFLIHGFLYLCLTSSWRILLLLWGWSKIFLKNFPVVNDIWFVKRYGLSVWGHLPIVPTLSWNFSCINYLMVSLNNGCIVWGSHRLLDLIHFALNLFEIYNFQISSALLKSIGVNDNIVVIFLHFNLCLAWWFWLAYSSCVHKSNWWPWIHICGYWWSVSWVTR